MHIVEKLKAKKYTMKQATRDYEDELEENQ